MGETVDAKPTPMPPTNRQRLSWSRSGASVLPSAESMKRIEATTRVLFRPAQSASHTPTRGPNGQPRIALPATNPIPNGVSWNSVLRKRTAPEISERS